MKGLLLSYLKGSKMLIAALILAGFGIYADSMTLLFIAAFCVFVWAIE